MKVKKILAALVAVAMALSCVSLPAFAADADYGTETVGADGSLTLNFGADSITVKGGGEIINDAANGNVKRPDNLKSDDSNLAVLTMNSVSLKGSGYEKLDLYAASNNDAKVVVKVGDTEVAVFDNVYNGSWDNYQVNTAELSTTEAEGNLTLNITGKGAKQYCGNYVYVKLYGSNVTPPSAAPAEPSVEPSKAPELDADMPYTIYAANFDESGKLSVSYGKKDDAPAAKLFAASYSDSSEQVMTNFKQFELSDNNTYDYERPESGITKVFIWDGTDKLTPLSRAAKIGGNVVTEAEAIYLDESYSFEERAADLVSRMTLEEKVSQIGHSAPAIERLGVNKYYYWREGLHGVARQGKATSFPSPFSMSNTWNRELVFAMADITSTEARVKNSRYDLSYWSPTVNMARDPRWGRNEECFGEDPYLTGQLGAEFVKGMQGDDEKYLKVISTPKHFAANNNETTRRGGTSVMSEFNFRNYYTKVFRNITEEVMPASVMASYNGITVYRNGQILKSSTGQTINYVPSAANSYLLQDLLRRNWGFDGYVTSDCGAGEDITDKAPYKTALLGNATSDKEQYIAQAYKNGLNVECSLGGGNRSQAYGLAAVNSGYLSEENLDRAVYELFLQRFKTGEFDVNAPYRDYKVDELESAEHVEAAEAAAEETWVLLKNDDNTLPLNSEDKNVVVVGPRAASAILGDYSGSPTNTVSPAEGIKAEVEGKYPGTTVTYIDGVSADTELLNIKSITVDGKAVDLSKADITGATLDGGVLKNVTKNTVIRVPSVNITDKTKINIEMAGITSPGAKINVHFGVGGPIGATAEWDSTKGIGEYSTYSVAWEGGAGGYTGLETMELTIEANPVKLDVQKYKTQLDAADVIIAYASTMWGSSGDSAENKDRANIELPASESDVLTLTGAYPEKTVVALQSVGQINVEPFMNKCKALLFTSYNGQTQGTAIGKILSGDVNPSGRLSTTWYKNADLSKMELANKTDKTIGGVTGKYTDYDLQATGSMPGRTYQYYKNTPIYPFGYGLSYTQFKYSNLRQESANTDANGSIVVKADVTNEGTAAGKEVVQLYVSHPNTEGDSNIPAKQLKGFIKTALLQPGEKQTVEFTINAEDLNLFSEENQKLYVPNGEYQFTIGKNASDASLSGSFKVTGTLKSELKTVKAIPDGTVVKGLVNEDGSNLKTVNSINANLSAVMTDDVWYDLSKAQVKYTSSNPDVVSVDENGKVYSGLVAGTALITAEVTIDGVTKSDFFPIVNQLEISPSAADIAAAQAELKAAYDKLPRAAYSDANLAEIDKIYGHGVDEINNAQKKSELEQIVAQKINNMNSVPMDNLNEEYSIVSENPKFIENGVIDYRDGGIPMYSGAAGTVTNAAPYSGIKLIANDKDGNPIDAGKISWQIKKFDNSVRKVAEIDNESGELTVYGNGIVEITAANLETMTCGRLMVQINMQIEGEYADDDGGAQLTDNQSGSSGGYDAGSTGSAWIEYKSVKLSNLESIVVRHAGKNAGTINVSLSKDIKDNIASVNAQATGGWSTWAETELTLDRAAVEAAQRNNKLDEYGCATVYIQTNGINLDYFRLNYIENNDQEPYEFTKVLNKDGGSVKVSLRYRGSTLSKMVPMQVTVHHSDGTESLSYTAVNGTGDYEVALGAKDGETIEFVVVNNEADKLPLSAVYEHTYKTPVDSEILVCTLGDSAYSKFVSGTDGEQLPEVNGFSGKGSWVEKSVNVSYTYSDVNEKEHKYTFTKAWQAGSGSDSQRCIYFTPKKPCRVTAVFKGSSGRDMYIVQDGKTLVTGYGNGTDVSFSAEITDTTKPVYVYGNGSNKNLHAVIVEYYGTAAAAEAEDYDRPVQNISWSGGDAVLTKNDLTGETKVWSLLAGGLRTELSTEYFSESDVNYNYDDKYTINALAAYKDRLYAACDGGLVIVFTTCFKCYKLKKPVDFDIKSMTIDGDVMSLYGETESAQIMMSALGGDTIEADEANVLVSGGGVLVDVRTPEEFAEKSVSGSVNIPIDEIESGLSAYGKDAVLIFYCSAGTRAEAAVAAARSLGYTNVYNLGSIDKII